MSYQFVKYIYLINAEFIYRKCRNKTLFINHNCKYLIKAKTTCKINGRIFPLSFRKLCPALKSYKVENYTTKLKAYSLWPVYVLPIDLTNSLLLILLYQSYNKLATYYDFNIFRKIKNKITIPNCFLRTLIHTIDLILIYSRWITNLTS